MGEFVRWVSAVETVRKEIPVDVIARREIIERDLLIWRRDMFRVTPIILLMTVLYIWRSNLVPGFIAHLWGNADTTLILDPIRQTTNLTLCYRYRGSFKAGRKFNEGALVTGILMEPAESRQRDNSADRLRPPDHLAAVFETPNATQGCWFLYERTESKTKYPPLRQSDGAELSIPKAAARGVYSECKNLCIWNKDNGRMTRSSVRSTSWCSRSTTVTART